MMNRPGSLANLVNMVARNDAAEPAPQQQVPPVTPRLTPSQQRLKATCSELELSAPRKQDGTLADEDDVIRRIENDEFVPYLSETDVRVETKQFLFFLYGRDFLREEPQTKRKSTILKILASEEAYSRLDRICESHSDDPDDGDGGAAFPMRNPTPNDFVRRWYPMILCYGRDDDAAGSGSHESLVTTIFSQFRMTMVFRKQLCSNCFLQAPAVVQCYLVQIGSGQFLGTMDIAKCVRRTFNSQQLERYLLTNIGDDSIDVFESILVRGGTCTTPSRAIHDDLVVQNGQEEFPEMYLKMMEMGPALVSRFYVERRFQNGSADAFPYGGIPSFSGEVRRDNGEHSMHAMALVGMRRDTTGMWWLLLQNWWEHMQFVEVSAKYFVSSGAKLVWCEKKQTRFRDDIPTVMSIYAEACVEGSDYHSYRFDRSSQHGDS